MKETTKRIAIDTIDKERKKIATYEIELLQKNKLDKYEKENVQINHILQRLFKEAIKDLWRE